jgi:hypothetical protein
METEEDRLEKILNVQKGAECRKNREVVNYRKIEYNSTQLICLPAKKVRK